MSAYQMHHLDGQGIQFGCDDNVALAHSLYLVLTEPNMS
jgi:hypothetical protein